MELTVEIKEQEQTPKIRGYAAVFNSLSEQMYGFREIIRPKAFAKMLDKDIRALNNHNPAFVLGRTKSGTLRLYEDERGLAIEVDVPNTQWANDLLESIKRGDVSQMSFAFRAIEDNWIENEDGTYLRELLEVELLEVSTVTFPAYADTSVGVRSFDEAKQEFEKRKEEKISENLDFLKKQLEVL